MSYLESYLLLERAALQLDGENWDLAEEVREVMDQVWSMLTSDERAQLNARGDIPGGPGPQPT